MNWKKKVKENNLIREHINILNGLIGLPPRQLDVLAVLMDIDQNWKPKTATDYKNILSTDTRKSIMEKTMINKNNLSKYLSDIKKRNLIIATEQGGYEVIPSIFPTLYTDKNGNEVAEINFILEIEEDSSMI